MRSSLGTIAMTYLRLNAHHMGLGTRKNILQVIAVLRRKYGSLTSAREDKNYTAMPEILVTKGPASSFSSFSVIRFFSF